MVRMLEGNEGEAETEVPRINVEIPRCSANLGSDQYFVKLPNFLSVETRSVDSTVGHMTAYEAVFLSEV